MSDEINLQRLRSEVRSLYKKIDTLSRGNASLRAKLEKIQAVVNEQAEDDGLWHFHNTAPEDYLQQALRRLHAVIEESYDE